jgi:hypothetical protein
MKKNEIKKLRLSRETLQILQGSETQKVVGGSTGSCQSGWSWCTSLGDDSANDTCACDCAGS